MNTNSLTSLCTQLQLEVSYYRFHSIPLCFWCWSMKSQTHTHPLCILSNFWLYEWGISGGFWLWRIAAEPEGVCDVCAMESRQISELLCTAREQRERADMPFTVKTHTHTHWAATRDLCCTTGILLQQTANDLSSAEDWSHRDFNPGQSHYSLRLFLPFTQH